MNKREVYEFLNIKGISYEITEHEAAFNMSELKDLKLLYPECEAKNLFVRDDKKSKYYLITVKGDKRVDLKKFRNKNRTRPLSFASVDDLFSLMKLEAGSVTPLGLLNNADNKIIFYIDKSFLEGEGLIGCHPNDNTATVWMKSTDLLDLISQHGNEIFIVEI
ncbi:prolyl-tRNA synthetase associated domain-containing protein [Peptoniphilaceae bacterium SGI.131]